MGEFVYFTIEQKERANAVPIIDILRREHEDVEKSGNEWRWKRHKSVTFRGNNWYRHSQQTGGRAIDFVQEFFDMRYPEAITYLLNGETGEVILAKEPQKEKVQEKKKLEIPKKNDNMNRVYAYLMKKRYINRDIISYFAKQGTLYESKDHHNIVFAGVDKEGNIRHIHKKGTYSEGKSFRISETGSDATFGFGYAGEGSRLYVFEAPIDLLSFLSLYPHNWKQNSYITLNGVSEHAMLGMLRQYENISEVILCLDHDAAGIEACGRLAEIVMCEGDYKVKRLQSKYKDWNEDLKNFNGVDAIPAEEHPKIMECRNWINKLQKTVAPLDAKYGTKAMICKYYNDMSKLLKKEHSMENLITALDGPGMILTGVLLKCVESISEEMGKPKKAKDVLEELYRTYRPYKDKVGLENRVRKLHEKFETVLNAFRKADDEKEILMKECMSLSMECIKAHIFIATDYQKMQLEERKGMDMTCSQM